MSPIWTHLVSSWAGDLVRSGVPTAPNPFNYYSAANRLTPMHSREMETRPVRVPVLTMLWNIGEDISKLFGMGLEGVAPGPIDRLIKRERTSLARGDVSPTRAETDVLRAVPCTSCSQ